MKNKLLSLLLVITMLAVTISTGLPSIFAAEENLITNGDFSDHTTNSVTGWGITLNSNSQASGKIEENVQITDDLKANVVTFKTGAAAGNNFFYHKNKINIEKNATYTMTFWVRVKNIEGFTAYFYEPDFVAKDGTYKTDEWQPADGTNIYTYSYDNGSTRVCRTDIHHSWKAAATGTELGDANGVSMFITRVNNTNQVLTPDFPATNKKGEWMQIIHTFKTGNLAAHEAVASYSFKFPGAVDGEVSFADFKMTVEKDPVDDYFTPAVNNDSLGLVSKDVPLISGKSAEITAEPFGENIFDGWFEEGILVSKNRTFTFTYDPSNPPKYEARFTKAAWGIDGSFETGYTNGQLLAQIVHNKDASKADTDWTENTWISTNKDGSGEYFMESKYAGNYRKMYASTNFAHTGKYSLAFSGAYGYMGRKLTDLTPNTDYIISFYATLRGTTATTFGDIRITAGNTSPIKTGGSNKTAGDSGMLLVKEDDYTFYDTWGKITVKFNSRDNTEAIFWMYHNNPGVVYIDNFTISRAPEAFKPLVNDSGLGSATSETTDVVAGAEVTVTAESINDGQFKGWYIGDQLMSKDKTYTFTYTEEFKDLTAKFEPGVNTLPDYSFETTYTNDQVLAQSPDVAYSTKNDTGLWNENLFKESSKDGDNRFFIDSEWAKWGKVIATNAKAHTGNMSIKMSPNSRFVGYKLTGLTKNTDYTISFYALTTGSTEAGDTVGSITITDAAESCMTFNSGTIVTKNETTGALLSSSGAGIDCRDTWKKFAVAFNTKESTDIILWVRPERAGTSLYIDDLTISFSPVTFRPVANNSGLGTVTPANNIQCEIGQSVTVNASPFEGSNFEGWYVGDELISTDAEFTFEYSDKYQGLTAVFSSIPGTIPNGSFEYNQNGQVLASYSNNSNPKFNNNPPWSVDTTYRTDGNLSLTVTNERAHTGAKSAVLNIPYRYFGMDINGLQPATEYMVSFWAYITGAEADSNDSNPKNVSSAFVAKQGVPLITLNDSGAWKVTIDAAQRLGQIDAQVDCFNKWSKIDIIFTTPKDTGDVTLYATFSGKSAKLYIDDLIIGQGVKVTASAELGGTVTKNFTSDYVLKGDEATFEAIPLEGNTFAGWYNLKGEKISDDAKYTFVANENTSLVAKFDGYNKPATDLFAMAGRDGTFENGTVPGWIFSDPTYDSPWCSASVSTANPYEGSKSLSINARYRNSILPLSGLNPNTDYRLSFYVLLPDANTKAKIDHIAVIGSEYNHLGTANTVFNQLSTIPSNKGWHKVDLYFNSGDNIGANLIIRYSAETTDGYSDRLFIDNLSLCVYAAAEEVVNGSFDEDKANWIGDGTIVTEAGNKALSLNANESVYQDLVTEPFSSYKVSFMAKGKLTSAAQDILKSTLNAKNFFTSQSYVDVDGTEWTEYSYDVYSGVHEAMKIVFTATEDGTMIDDFKFTKNIETAGSILEKIDFETDRFMLSQASQELGYSIYGANGENDPYVYSGSKSLKFTYNETSANLSKLLEDAWLSYQPGLNRSLKVSFKYKVVDGKAGGFINLSPDCTGIYGGDTGFEHMAQNTEWHDVIFYLNNTTYGALKAVIGSVGGNTRCDFYVDDIVIAVAPPMVNEENSKITYCERLYNAVDNEGFENPVTDKDWKGLPSTAQIVKGDALKGSHFLRAKAGTHYVVAVPVKGGTEYYFAASVRGTASTVGSIGITLDGEGETYFANRDEIPASMVSFNPNKKGWQRSGFKFTTDNSGYAYLTIDVDSGALDIDSIMMFTSDYGYRYDPNDYTVYVPYDYDNLKSATTVINGGFGAQPYYKGDGTAEDDSSGSPSTGDSVAMPVMIIVLAVAASTALMLIRKRKEGAENA